MGNHFLKKDFLESGALLVCGQSVYLGLGSFQRLKNPNEPAFFCPDFFLEHPCPWVQFQNFVILSHFDFQAMIESWSRPVSKSYRQWFREDKKYYERQFSAIMELIKSKKAEKIVSTSYSHSPKGFSGTEFLSALSSLLRLKEKTEVIYAKWGGGEISFLGKTPEILFELDQKKKTLYTMALAGTKKNPLTHEEPSLLEDKKELHEHNLVVQFLQKKLIPLGELSVSSVEQISFKKLAHLKTKMLVHLKNEIPSVMDICHQLHPTPALAIVSESLGADWLKPLRSKECYRFFGAPFGIRKDEFSFLAAVSIRQVCWTSQQSYIPVGCGIVEQSLLNKEWEELGLKTEAIKTGIGVL